MKARQLIGGSAFPPDVLTIVFEAFDDAWSDIAPVVGCDAGAIESARISLATITLSLAKAGPVDRDRLKGDAVAAFRFKHRLAARPSAEAKEQ
jgi:hypothetical protein